MLVRSRAEQETRLARLGISADENPVPVNPNTRQMGSRTAIGQPQMRSQPDVSYAVAMLPTS
jgi:hypothetical protein